MSDDDLDEDDEDDSRLDDSDDDLGDSGDESGDETGDESEDDEEESSSSAVGQPHQQQQQRFLLAPSSAAAEDDNNHPVDGAIGNNPVGGADLYPVDPETQAKLEALFETAGIGKLAGEANQLTDPEVSHELMLTWSNLVST